MRRRPTTSFHPHIERFEAKPLLSASAAGVAHAALISRPHHDLAAKSSRPAGYLAYRITNPTNGMVNLTPPFQQVLVQKAQPVPGQVYNILFVAVKNETKQTFTASDGFTVRTTSGTGSPGSAGKAFPVLTGDQVWKPDTWMVFYVLSKKYYPLQPEVSAGFQLDAGGRSSTMVPGPSGIALRITYDPAAFAKTLDSIVAYGAGAEGGGGAKLGLPDTAINALVSAKTDRQDFAGHF
jgi:hypothetical protein